MWSRSTPTGISAKSGNLSARGDFARLVADLPAQHPDLCIVANVDRLTRSELFAELGAVWGPLQEAGVRVATAGGQVLDLNTPDGQLMAFLESYRSARENAARSERTLAGRIRAAREGRNPGRPPYGYRWTREAGWSAPAPPSLEVYQRSAAGRAATRRRRLSAARRQEREQGGFTDSRSSRSSASVGDPYVTGLWIGQQAVPDRVVDPGETRRAVPPRQPRTRPTHAARQLPDDNALSCALRRPVRIASSNGRQRDSTRARFAYIWTGGGSAATAAPLHAAPVPVGELAQRHGRCSSR
jgi:DNA invertase Pin-like site-specific DNA recombinase